MGTHVDTHIDTQLSPAGGRKRECDPFEKLTKFDLIRKIGRIVKWDTHIGTQLSPVFIFFVNYDVKFSTRIYVFLIFFAFSS